MKILRNGMKINFTKTTHDRPTTKSKIWNLADVFADLGLECRVLVYKLVD